MMKTRLQEDLMIGDLEGLVLDKLLIEVLKPRAGERKESLIFSITVKQRGPAFELFRFIKEGQFNLKNIEAANTPNKEGNYIVSVTLKKLHNVFDVIDGILKYIKQLVNINKWYFIFEDTNEIKDWNRNNFNKVTKGQSGIDVVKNILRAGISKKDNRKEMSESTESVDHRGIEKIIEEQLSHYGKTFIESLQEQIQPESIKSSNYKSSATSRKEIEDVIKKHLSEYNKTFTKSLQDQFKSVKKSAGFTSPKETDKKEFEEIIGKQLSRHSKVFIKSLQEQIQTIKHDNTRLSKYIDDLKSDQQGLYQQLQLYQKREKIAILREQEDYKRIRGLEKKLAVLAPPENGKVEIVIPPSDSSNKETNKKKYPTTSTELKVDEPKLDETKIKQIIESTIETVTKRLVSKEEIKSSDKAIEEGLINREFEKSDATDLAISGSTLDATDKELGIHETDERDTNFLDSKLDGPPQTPSEMETTTESKLVDEYFALGMAASERKEYSEAIKYYSKVTELLPSAPPSYFNLSVLYYRLNEYEKAKKFAQKAVDLGAISAKFIIEKIENKQKSIKVEREKDEVNESTISDIKITEPPVVPVETLEISESNKEKVIDDDQKIDEIEVTTKTGLSKDTQDISIGKKEPLQKSDAGKEFFALGLMASEHKEYQKAIEFFSKSAEISPNSSLSYLNMAVLYCRLKEYEIAKKYAERALELGAKPAERVLENINTILEEGEEKTDKLDGKVFTWENDQIAEEEYLKPEFIEEIDEDIHGTDVPIIPIEKTESTNLKTEEVEPKKVKGTLDETLDKKNKIKASDTIESVPEEEATIEEPDDLEPISEEEIKIRDEVKLEKIPEEDTQIDEPEDLKPVIEDDAKIEESSEIQTFPQEEAILLPSEITETIPIKDPEIGGTFDLETVPAEQPKLSEPDNLVSITKEDEQKKETPIQESSLEETKQEKIPVHDDIVKEKTDKQTPFILDITPLEKIEKEVPSLPDEKPLKGKKDEESAVLETAVEEKTKIDETVEKVQVEEKTVELPSDEGNTADEYFAMGLEASDQKDYRKAVEYFIKVTDLLPDASPSYFNLANLHLHLKNYESAKKYAQKAVALGGGPAVQIIEKIENILNEKQKTKNNKFKAEDVSVKKRQESKKAEPSEIEDTQIIESKKDNNDKKEKDIKNLSFESKTDEIYKTKNKIPVSAENNISIKTKTEQQPIQEPTKDESLDIDSSISTVKDKESETQGEKVAEDLSSEEKTDEIQETKNDIAHTLEKEQDVKEVTKKQPELEEKEEVEKKFVSEDLKETDKKSEILDLKDSKKVSEKTPKDYFLLGLSASEKKEHKKAIKYFNKVIRHLPNSIPSLINLSVLYYRLKDFETAKKHANEALRLGENSAKRILKKIEIKIKKKLDTNYSVETVEPPTEEVFIWGADDFDGEAAFNDDEITPEQQNQKVKDDVITFDKSESESKIIVLDSDSIQKTESIDKIFTNGLKASEKKEYHKAIEIFTKVLETIPDSAHAYLNLAVLNYKIREYETARKQAVRAVELGAETSDKILEKIEKKLGLHKKQTKSKKVEKTTKKKVKKQKKAEKKSDKSIITSKKKVKKKPEKKVTKKPLKKDIPQVSKKEKKDEVTKIKPETKSSKITTANKKSQAGTKKIQTIDDKKSIEEVDRLNNKKVPKTEQHTKDLEVQSKEKEVSTETITKSLEKKTIPSQQSVNEYFALGLEASENKEYDKAIECFNIVTDLLPDAPPSFLNLANLYFDLKDYENAKKNAEKAFDLGSQSAVLILDKIEAVQNEVMKIV